MAKKDEPFLPLNSINVTKSDVDKLTKIIEQKGGVMALADEVMKPMVLCKYFDEGDNICHAYVTVLPSKVEEYLKELARGKRLLDPAQYGGEVVRHGRGYPPAKEIQEEMEKMHAINHNLYADMQKMMKDVSKTVKGKYTFYNQPRNKK